MANVYAGIDFGTTNTAAAIVQDGMAPRVISIENEDSTTPSAIFFEEKSGLIFFGRLAMKKYMEGEPGRLMRSLKRVLGTSLMRTSMIINGKIASFQEIICEFLKNVKSKLDLAAGRNIDCVVMGRPVHFRDNDTLGDENAERELEQIAKKAGFKKVLFQFEPIAAALAHERKIQDEVLAAVVDIGGGTSDFSIIRLGGKLAQKSCRKDDILANTGIRIGGNDFDKQLSVKTFMPLFGKDETYNAGTVSQPKILPMPNTYFFDLSEWSQVNSLYTYKNINMVNKYLQWSGNNEKVGRLAEVIEYQLGHKVLATVEDTKIALTDNNFVDTALNFLSSSKTVVKANRLDFEDSISGQVSKILASVNDCVKMSGTKPNEVQLIILTGGSTEIPYVRDTLCKVFPNAKLSAKEKLSSVGLGLAFDAAKRFVQ